MRELGGAFRARGATVVPARQPGIASQRQEGARYVLQAGGEKIITHEPEKPSTPEIAHQVADMLDDHAIVVIGRTEESKDSMPPFQRRTEELAGWVLERTLNLPADALAGPRGYNQQGMRHLLEYPSHQPGMNNWIYMYDNPLQARASGDQVGGMKANLIYPEAQTAQEAGNPAFDRKRYDQFTLQLDYLLNKPEVESHAYGLRTAILGSIALMPEQPTDGQIQDFFTTLEDRMRAFGYVNHPRQQ
ncbi:MAG: hypothetical protein Q4B06_00820 [Candidatus Saccharibacteria bacterium]|nr:hypothetical protein [Candidatus Saccharibacteria bacterium]